MTIKQLAEELEVTPQAVYKRLRTNGVEVKQLVNQDSKELTADGEVVIRKLFSKDQPTKKTVIEEYEKRLKAANVETAELKEQLKELKERLEKLQAEKDEAMKALLQEQELHKKVLDRYLPAGNEKPSERLTWRERLTGRRNK